MTFRLSNNYSLNMLLMLSKLARVIEKRLTNAARSHPKTTLKSSAQSRILSFWSRRRICCRKAKPKRKINKKKSENGSFSVCVVSWQVQRHAIERKTSMQLFWFRIFLWNNQDDSWYRTASPAGAAVPSSQGIVRCPAADKLYQDWWAVGICRFWLYINSNYLLLAISRTLLLLVCDFLSRLTLNFCFT